MYDVMFFRVATFSKWWPAFTTLPPLHNLLHNLPSNLLQANQASSEGVYLVVGLSISLGSQGKPYPSKL